MKILAFDIAYSTGWAATDTLADAGVAYGSFGVECDGENGLGRCLYNFRRELYRLIDKWKPDVLAWELPLPGTKHGARYDDFVRGAVGILRVAAFELDLRALPCDQKRIRKHFIGDGRPSPEAKQQVWLRCKALGYQCANDDESDAIAVWDYATGVMRVREYEQKDRARLRRQAGG